MTDQSVSRIEEFAAWKIILSGGDLLPGFTLDVAAVFDNKS
jgi:hypothetical protein